MDNCARTLGEEHDSLYGYAKNMEGATVYVFVVNGQQKEIREGALKQHPGCFEALPAAAKAQIAANRSWMSKL